MKHGTLEIIKEESEDWFSIASNYEIELMIERIIPSSKRNPLRVRVQPENTRFIRMIMREYPLTIVNPRKWEWALDEIKEKEELARNVTKLEYVEPDKQFFIGELLPFQKQGLDFLLKTKGKTLVTDEMGLGKTIEALAFIASKKDTTPIIVVAPLVTLINWKREIEKFLGFRDKRPDNQTLLNEGEQRKPVVELIRRGRIEGEDSSLNPADFYLINYELMDKRCKDLINVNPKTVILDEIHCIRNVGTGKYNACKFLTSHKSVLYKIGLSGTPIYNRGIEMFNICEVIRPGILGDRAEFIRRYCQYWYTDKTKDEAKEGLSDVLRKTIMIRRKKIDVLPDLPEKIRMKQTIDIDTSLYESEIEKLYDKISVAREQLTSYDKDNEDEMKIGLFEVNKSIREMRIAERQIAGLAKAPFVVDYMNDLLEQYDEEKFVIFCHHINVHKAIFDGLWRYNPVQIIGGQSDKVRQEAIDKFQNNDLRKTEQSRVIICGLRAGNMGINLTSSAYVIFAELDWSPSVHRQAEDRLHRIGQKHKVFAHYLEGSGTFDEILSNTLLDKTVEITNALGDKMESLDNKKAVEFLESRYKFQKTSKIAELIINPVPDHSSKATKLLGDLDRIANRFE